MISCLAYGTDRDIVGIAIVAALAIVNDKRVSEAHCWLERSSARVARATILARRQMGSWFSVERVARRAEVPVVAGRAVVGTYARMVKCRSDKKDRWC